VQYLGGAPDIPDRKKGWDSKLTITEDKLLCSLKSGPSFEIRLDLIEAINYGSLRVTRAAFAAVSVVAWPSALLGRYPKAKSHLVGIEFRRESAPNAGILLRVDKDDIEPFLETLRLRLASHSKNSLNKKEKERAPS